MSTDTHVAITRIVREGCEAEFERRLKKFAQRSLIQPGACGVLFIFPPPGSGSREYGILRSFSSPADRKAFYESPLYREWLSEVAPLVEGQPTYRDLHGLEAWFFDPTVVRPPRWKMAILTWLAVWPVSLVANGTLGPILAHLPLVWRSAIMAAVIVGALTWPVMPIFVKIARCWLHPDSHPSKIRNMP